MNLNNKPALNEYEKGFIKENQYSLSGREIAKILGRSKSVVNNYKKEINEQTPTETKDGPRILILDVETAAATALTFGRFKVNLSQDNIVTEGGWLLCASWRWLGSKETGSIRLSPAQVLEQDDITIVAKLWDMIEEADAIVAHNGCSFDHKVIQTRAAFWSFPPLPTVKVLDTLLLAKRYLRLPSNRLDSIGEYFDLGRKVDTGGIKLWKEVQEGNEEAMQRMVTYCEQDVNLLHDVYVQLRQLGVAGNGFNAGLYYDDEVTRCSVCGSSDIHPIGRTTKTTLSTFKEYRCDSCGAVHKNRESVTTKSKRKSLLVV